ncbi:DUF1275 domain-containing protein [Pantoea sp. JGM49]|uniref:YoaK family protein n=1 Tax=Pantoea sp. JGM49 TaxID=2799791 RepID=UPI001BAE3135|nr:YoaK family protein [Pantoea sp. JGM49]MBS0881312.1 DUF1275 domain-containing protein [Pantoea sp. JGM49]
MLIKLKRTRTHVEDRNLALCLATSAGLLNAMALAAFGFFPSHMSGNIAQISSDLNEMDIRNLKVFIAMIGAFVTGAVVARISVVLGVINGLRTIFSCILLVEGVLLILTSLFEIYYFSSNNNAEILLLLAFLMGVHNSTSTQLSNGRVRSTHITGTLTDAGISIGSVFVALLRRDPSKNIRAFKQQLNTHLVTIFSFLTGGIVGLLIFNALGFGSLIGPGLILVVIATLSIICTLYKVKRRGYAKAIPS